MAQCPCSGMAIGGIGRLGCSSSPRARSGDTHLVAFRVDIEERLLEFRGMVQNQRHGGAVAAASEIRALRLVKLHEKTAKVGGDRLVARVCDGADRAQGGAGSLVVRPGCHGAACRASASTVWG